VVSALDGIKPCVTWPTHTCELTHSYVCVTWRTGLCDVTHSYMWHDAFMCVSLHIHICDMTPASPVRDMTHLYMWHDAFIHVTWRIHICDVTHLYMWQDAFIHGTWRIHICDMTNSYMRSYTWHASGSKQNKTWGHDPWSKLRWTWRPHRSAHPSPTGYGNRLASALPPTSWCGTPLYPVRNNEKGERR